MLTNITNYYYYYFYYGYYLSTVRNQTSDMRRELNEWLRTATLHLEPTMQTVLRTVSLTAQLAHFIEVDECDLLYHSNYNCTKVKFKWSVQIVFTKHLEDTTLVVVGEFEFFGTLLVREREREREKEKKKINTINMPLMWCNLY